MIPTSVDEDESRRLLKSHPSSPVLNPSSAPEPGSHPCGQESKTKPKKRASLPHIQEAHKTTITDGGAEVPSPWVKDSGKTALSMQPKSNQGQERSFTKIDDGGKRERRGVLDNCFCLLY
jgi:hypothetical protein